MKFPRLMFRSPGPEQCLGGTYAHKLAQDSDEYAAQLQEGWHGTLPEALAPAPVIVPVVVPKEPEPAVDAPPTSEEIRRKAQELGLKVHHKASDATVLAMVTARLAEA